MHISNNNDYLVIFESNFQELYEFIHSSHTSLANSEDQKLVLLYAKVLYSYMQADITQLEKYVAKLDELKIKSEFHEFIYHLANQRLLYRLNLNDENLVSFLKVSVEKYPMWKAEVHFTAGMAYMRLRNFFDSRREFSIATKEFYKLKCFKRSVLCEQNALTQEKSMNPDKRFISELKIIIKKAKSCDAKAVVGLCSMALSMELSEIGAMEKAWLYINKSIKSYAGHDETFQFYITLNHHATIGYQLGYFKEAEESYIRIKESSHPELKASLYKLNKLRKKYLNKSDNFLKVTPLNEHDEYIKDITIQFPDFKLGELEEKLVIALSEGAKTRDELIAILYGDNIDISSLKARLKVLLFRVKKKLPNLIHYRPDKKYSLKKSSKYQESA